MTLVDEILIALRDDGVALGRAEDALVAELERRQIHFGDGLLPTYCVPFFADGKALDGWIADAEALAHAVEDVARGALHDPALMRALNLRPDAREWVEIDPGYERISVLARPDAIFLDDGSVRYVEYNSDSPAMMAFSDHVSETLLALPHLAQHRHKLRAERMLPKLYATLLACYRSYGGSGAPTIALCDWPGQKTRFEHARIAEYFESQGSPTVICDPRALSRPNKKLELEGRRIDLVYRRALFAELLEKKSEVEPLVSAYRDGSVCMVNPLRSYLASSKTLLAFLCDHWPASRGPCPVMASRILDDKRIAELRAKDEPVVLKKGESHGGVHVLLPELSTREQRLAALVEAEHEPWIEQAFAPLPKLAIPTRADAGARKFFNWNPFLFDGRYAGAIARASDTPLINITLGGGLLPTLRVEP